METLNETPCFIVKLFHWQDAFEKGMDFIR